MSRVIRTTVLIVLGLFWLLPVYLLIVNAAKAPETFTSKESWIPKDFSLFVNMGEAMRLSGLAESAASTLLYAIVAPAIAVTVGAAAGSLSSRSGCGTASRGSS